MARAKDPRAPEGKTTRELANDRSMRMHAVLFCVDEVQVLFAKACEFRDEAEQLLTDIVKRGRAVGMIAVLATQKPDKDSSADRHQGQRRHAVRHAGTHSTGQRHGPGWRHVGGRVPVRTRSRRADLGVGYLVGASADR